MSKKKVENRRIIEIEAAVPKDYEIEYWYRRDQEMPESEQEHVKEMLEQGYTSGELIYESCEDQNENTNRGWWNIKSREGEA